MVSHLYELYKYISAVLTHYLLWAVTRRNSPAARENDVIRFVSNETGTTNT